MLNLEISNDFHKFIKSLNETNSKHAEERVIYREISKLKLSFQNKNINKNEIYKNLMKCMHMEMLGFSTKFAYIHAVNLAQDKDLKFKSLGYLCCTLMLQNNNDLIILLINTIQKDLSSGNVMNKIIVLNNLNYLINEEMLEIVLPMILNCLTHENELVRKKTIILLTHIYQRYPTHLHTNITHIIEKGIYDINPSVMNVTLTLLRIYLTNQINLNSGVLGQQQNELWINVLINIWKQILDNKLNRTYYYNRIPAPFIQLNIMKLLSLLCHNIELSNLIYNILYKFTQSLESHTSYGVNTSNSSNIINTINTVNSVNSMNSVMDRNVNVMMIYEFMKLLSNIHINHILLSIASIYISKLLNGGMSMCYVSIKSINKLMDKKLSITTEDQLKLLKLLSSDDEIIQIHILKLLFKLINKNNFKLIFNTIFTHYHNLTHKSFIEYNTINYLTSDSVDKGNSINSGEGATTISAAVTAAPNTNTNNTINSTVNTSNTGDTDELKLMKWKMKIMLELLLKSGNVFFILNNVIKLLNSNPSLVQWLYNKCIKLLPNQNIKLLLIHITTHYTINTMESVNSMNSVNPVDSVNTMNNVNGMDQVLKSIISGRWDKLKLYWIYNNLRHFYTEFNNTGNNVLMGNTNEMGYSMEMENSIDMENSMEMCKSIYIRQLMVEMKNMKKYKMKMTNNKSYDIKLSFLTDWVDRDVRRYERKKYEPEPTKEQKLNFKPYQLISHTTTHSIVSNMENTVDSVNIMENVETVRSVNTIEREEEKLIIDIKNKSWGPKGYIHTTKIVDTINTTNTIGTVNTVDPVDSVDQVNTVNPVTTGDNRNEKLEEELAKKIFENINPTL